MKVFFDTNVLLDVLDKREPYNLAAFRIWARVETGKIDGFISAISFNNIYYLHRRTAGREDSISGLKLLRDVFHVVALDDQILARAIDSDLNDFEDAIQYFSAHHAGAKFILTRNSQHFPAAPISIMTPEEFLSTEAG
jgi:predicted nucleic acid-binding protein